MPLARGKQAAEIHAVLAELSSRFLRVEPTRVAQTNLSNGLAAVALAHAGLAPLFPDAGHAEHAGRALDLAVARLGQEDFAPTLHEGFVGVAWVAQHLQWGVEEAGDDPCAGIDAALDAGLAVESGSAPYDLLAGYVGIGIYAIERMPRPSAAALLAKVVDRLASAADHRPPHRRKTARALARPPIAWRSDPAWVPEEFRGNGHADWNLGVAHGVPGIVGFLGLVCASACDETTRRKARALLEAAVTWLLSCELARKSPSCFPRAHFEGAEAVPSRSGWCYGDPGIALALMVAARGAGERTWERHAIRIGLRAAERAPEDTGVIDGGLCHGAAGLAHMFHRLHRITGEQRFANAARRWLTRTLSLRQTGRNAFGGFSSYELKPNGKVGWNPSLGFITGAAGVALTLAAAIGTDEPTWDRLLLMS